MCLRTKRVLSSNSVVEKTTFTDNEGAICILDCLPGLPEIFQKLFGFTIVADCQVYFMQQTPGVSFNTPKISN